MEVLKIPYSKRLSCKKPLCQINVYKFSENDIGPNVDIYSCHNRDTIKFKFKVFEPIIEVQNFYPNFASEINKDSTVGILLQPYNQDPKNLLLRVNAVGAYYLSFGQWYWNRADCTFEDNEFLRISNNYQKTIDKKLKNWEITIEIDLPKLFKFINVTEWKYTPKTVMYGNFLKVSNFPKSDAHFGMWSKVERNLFDCYKSDKLGQFILE
jgi:hypothetical protein